MVFGNMQVYGRVGDSVVELMSSLSEVLAHRGVTFTLWADKTKMTNDGEEVGMSTSTSMPYAL